MGPRIRPDRSSLRILGLVLFLIPVVGWSLQQLTYDVEYEVIEYGTRPPTDSVALLQQEIDTGAVALEFGGDHGYLLSVLEKLDIDPASQMLVFSRTSFQVNRISPRSPRALYFNDDVYVGWLPDAEMMELSAMDPDLGVVFYTLDQAPAEFPRFERKTGECLRCHDTYSLTGGGVPRHLVGSGFTDQFGGFATHEGWHLTTYQSALEERWGGWYVTGTHGDQRHMGNIVVNNVADPTEFDLERGANVTDLSALLDTGRFLSGDSDIASLMVFEHQTTLQSLIVRVNFETRKLLAEEAERNIEQGRASDYVSDETVRLIEDWAEPLVGALLLVGEPVLTDPIVGTSGFAESFSSRGPRDTQGRSLRELDLRTRLFRYPCSYVIYSKAFDGLPGPVRTYIYRRLDEVLNGEPGEDFAHLSPADRTAILEILTDTKPEFALSLSETSL